MQIITRDSQQTINFGRKLSRFLKKGDIVALYGNLGTGKTTLVKGIAQGLGIKKEKINSPSFILLKKYKGKLILYHFDFYRIQKAQDAYSVGLEEFLFSDGISVIEWADRIEGFLPREYLSIELEFKNTDKRKIKLIGFGRYYRNLIKNL
jgi:tRNA threonylcarbamoyladenosine biosynthesis protein TsaE